MIEFTMMGGSRRIAVAEDDIITVSEGLWQQTEPCVWLTLKPRQRYANLAVKGSFDEVMALIKPAPGFLPNAETRARDVARGIRIAQFGDGPDTL